MTDLDFLNGCNIAPDTPDAEMALKLRTVLAQQLSKFKPEEIIPEMTWPELSCGKTWFADDPDAVEFVLLLEETFGFSIPDEAAEYLIAPWLNPQKPFKEILVNWIDILDRVQKGENFPPRELTFWTDCRWYHWAAWGLPIIGVLLLAGTIAGMAFIAKKETLWPLILTSVSLTIIWLGVPLWKRHRVTLDRLRPNGKYRAVLYQQGKLSVRLEAVDFSDYGGWAFADAVTAELRAKEIADLLQLPLEKSEDLNLIFYSGWNPPDWTAIDTISFFRELVAFCESCKSAGYAAEVETLLNKIRRTSVFVDVTEAVNVLCRALSSDCLASERETLFSNMEQTKIQLASWFQFLADCGIGSGTANAFLARKILRFCAAANHASHDEKEHELTADKILGDVMSWWFKHAENIDDEFEHEEEKSLTASIALGEDYETFRQVNPQAEWTLKELVRRCGELADNKRRVSEQKRQTFEMWFLTVFLVVSGVLGTAICFLVTSPPLTWKLSGSLIVSCIVMCFFIVTIKRKRIKQLTGRANKEPEVKP